MKWRGKSNRLGGSVDLGLLPRFPKGLQVVVARMGDLVLWSFATMEERAYKPQQPPEVDDDYLYPSEKSSNWGQLTPESPACKGQSLRLPGAKASESPECFLKDSRGATEACTTRVKNKFGRPDSLAGVSGPKSKSSAFTGQSLWLWDPESPHRKSPKTGFLQSSLNYIAKGCKRV
jgi:hypothetical protein